MQSQGFSNKLTRRDDLWLSLFALIQEHPRCADFPPAEVKVGTRHSGGFIAIFCDGHAKWQPGPDKVRCGMWSIEAGD